MRRFSSVCLFFLLFSSLNFAHENDTKNKIPEATISTLSTASAGNTQSSGKVSGLIGDQGGFLSLSDVDLSQGNLNFSRTDLTLPGKNGLDLNITRSYSSTKYYDTADPTYMGRFWSPWIGHGWSLNVGQRAYFINIRDQKYWHKEVNDMTRLDETGTSRTLSSYDRGGHHWHIPNRVVIDTGAGAESYLYEEASGFWVSKNPQNTNLVKVDLKTNQIILTQPGGTKLFYSKPFYHEKHRFTSQKSKMRLYPLEITGFYLEKIEDVFGNKIVYEYESYGEDVTKKEGTGSPDKVYKELKRISAFSAYYWTDLGDYIKVYRKYKDKIKREWNQYAGYYVGYEKIVKKLRPKKVIDTFGREVNFTHKVSHPYLVTGFTYKGVNYDQTGVLNQVKYEYHSDIKSSIKSAQLNNFPKETYGYWFYGPKMKIFVAATGQLIEVDGLEKEKGWFLNEITSPLGAKVLYQYQELYKGMKYGKPAVSSKEIVSAEGERSLFEFVYPYKWGSKTITKKNNWGNDVQERVSVRLVRKSSYKIPWLDGAKGYYHKKVVVKRPHGMVDLTYHYKDGLLYKQHDGLKEIEKVWDYDTRLITKEITRQNGKVLNHAKYIYTKAYFADGSQKKYSSTEDMPLELDRKGIYLKHWESPHAGEDRGYYNFTKYVFKTPKEWMQKNYTGIVEEKSTGSNTRGPRVSTKTYFVYNDNGQPIEIYKDVYKGNSATKTLVSKMEYDNVGRVIKKIKYNGPNSAGVLSTTTYSPDHEATLKITVEGSDHKATKEFEKYTGRLINSYTANAPNYPTKYYYDDIGRMTKTWHSYRKKTWSYPDLNTTISQFALNASKVVKDSLGRVVTVTSLPGNHNVSTIYNFGGQVKSTKSGNQSTSFIYDKYGRVKKKATSFGTTSYEYNDVLREVIVTGPKGRQGKTNFDVFGKTVKKEFLPDNSISSFEYDAFNQLINTTDPRGLKHGKLFDGYGNMIERYYTHSTGEPKVQFSYDVYPDGTPDVVKIYDKNGKVVKEVSSDYDDFNRVQHMKIDGENKQSIEYGNTFGAPYYAKGKVKKVQNSDSISELSYNLMGQVSQVKKQTLLTEGAMTMNYSFKHFHEGRETNINVKNESGEQLYHVDFKYNANHKLDDIHYGDKRLFLQKYHADGRPNWGWMGNYLNFEYTYEKESLVKSFKVKDKNKNIIFEENYSYDDQGLLKSVTTPDLFNPGHTISRTYEYTIKDELESVTVKNKAPLYVYAYDKNGNRTLFQNDYEKPKTPNMVYDTESDQLRERVFVNLSGSQTDKLSFTHDAEGRMTHQKLASLGHPREYKYNYQGQVSEIMEGGKTIAKYTYDTNKQRISKTVFKNGQAKRTLYHWDNSGRIIGEGTVEDPFKIKYIYRGNSKFAMVRKDSVGAEKIYYFINDIGGTPRAIIDADGKIVQKFQIDEYGNVERAAGLFVDEINYTGKKLDRESGLYYFNQRYYDPGLGRFISPDPAKQTLNPYMFVANNPLMFVDADGQWFWALMAAAAKGAATSMAINAGVQLVTTGQINLDSVLRSGMTGALSAGLSFGIGEAGQFLELAGGESLIGKTIAHGVSGGVTSMAGGGSFGSGFVGGAMANVTGMTVGKDAGLLDGAMMSGVMGGVGSMLGGGNFGDGFQNGAMQYTYNHFEHRIIRYFEDYVEKSGVVQAWKDLEIRVEIGNLIQSVPAQYYNIGSLGLGIAGIPATGGASLLCMAGATVCSGLSLRKSQLDFAEGKANLPETIGSQITGAMGLIKGPVGVIGTSYGIMHEFSSDYNRRNSK